MSSAALRLPTFDELYEEIRRLPEGSIGEILGPGELRVMSRPGARHRFGARRVQQGLRGHDLMDGGVGWWIEAEPEILLPDGRLYVPDLCGWRCAAVPDFIEENPINVVPDWACEILSRGTQRADRVRKLPRYAEAGVGHVWVLDPEARTLEVYETREGKPLLVVAVEGEVLRALPPFPGEFDVGALWMPPPGSRAS